MLLCTPFLTNAAALYIDPARPEMHRGDAITLAVRLDVDEETGECVNVVDGVISYTDNIQPVDISTGNSIFSLWVESPTIDREARTITFAGGIPNGYCGRVDGDPRLTNVITEIIFRSPGFMVGASDDTVARISFTDQTRAYLNSVDGREAPLETYGSEIKLHSRPGNELQNDWQEVVEEDSIPPEEFSIFLEQNPSGKYYITFNTTDKQTGVDHYEVMEEPLAQLGTFQWGRADAPWIKPDHPNVHVLEDQSLNSIIRVKAVDKAGNTYIANLIPDESMRTVSRAQIVLYSYGAGVLVMILLVGFTLWRWFRARGRQPDSGTETEMTSAPSTEADEEAVEDEEEYDEEEGVEDEYDDEEEDEYADEYYEK